MNDKYVEGNNLGNKVTIDEAINIMNREYFKIESFESFFFKFYGESVFRYALKANV